MAMSKDQISEGLYDDDLWDRLDFHLKSYVKSPLQLKYISSKTSVIGRALRYGIVNLLDNITNKQSDYIENDTIVIGTEHRLCHSCEYRLKVEENGSDNDDNEIDLQINSLAPTIFSQLRKDIGISNENFRQSFSHHHLKDFTHSGKSGSLMYKTHDDLFILKTLREYEARLLLQILSGYHLQLTQRLTIFNRYIGLYSVRLQAAISTIEIFVVVMANAFTPALEINEIFDLKGSTIKRNCFGYLSREKLFKLKDLDFMELYPQGIRIPTNIYQKLKLVIANDAKVLKKLNITDFSLILGVKHLDMTEEQMLQRRSTTGVGVLCSISNRFGVMSMMKPESDITLPAVPQQNVASVSIPYLKPLEMLNEQIDKNFYYADDTIAHASLPIPGIINHNNQRVYLYLAFIDMLQTFDSFKLIDQAFRKLTNYDRHLEYSVIEPDDYEKRINQFLFERVFIDAKDDFPWNTINLNQSVVEINNEDSDNKNNNQQNPHTIEREQSNTVLEFRL